MQKKVVDTKEYVSVLRDLVQEGKEVSMVIAGNSMSPFLVHERDIICFQQPDRKLKKGDMVFFQRPSGNFIMHRVCKVRPEGYYIVGDAHQEVEGPVKREQIFAIVTRVKRKNKWISAGDFWWEFFEHVWINIIPFRRKLCRLYGVFARGTRKDK